MMVTTTTPASVAVNNGSPSPVRQHRSRAVLHTVIFGADVAAQLATLISSRGETAMDPFLAQLAMVALEGQPAHVEDQRRIDNNELVAVRLAGHEITALRDLIDGNELGPAALGDLHAQFRRI